ncbi:MULTISPECIES: hypothetical protein [unclassified Microcoleus]|uniref:hypothetical protein n=1 Tax=unclassified Microcoleus TaxID=2642155 RepID=UPI002FD56777
MADYTFHSLTEPLKNNSTIQTILDVDALAAPAKAALAAYVTSLGLPSIEAQHLTWENVGVAVLIRSLALTYYLPSLGTQTPAADVKRTSTLRDRVTEMQKLQSGYPKCQMLIYGKTTPASEWIWLNTEVIQNSGNQVNTLKLLPYINQMEDFAPGRGCAIGIQFIADLATGATLPQAGDRITAQGSVFLDVNPIADSKKNDGASELESRLAALETLLQPFGAATAETAGTTGLVPGAAVGQTDFLLRSDRTWQTPTAFVRMVGEQLIEGIKTFAQTIVGNKTIRSTGSDSLSTLSSESQSFMFSTGSGGYFGLASAVAPTNRKLIDFGLSDAGVFTIRRLNDAYNAVVSTLLEFDAAHNLRLFNFTNFGGNVSLKFLKIEGTLPSTQGGAIELPLGVSSSKVEGIIPFVQFDNNGRIPPGNAVNPGCEYGCFIDDDVIVMKLHATNSANIVSKPWSCLIFYSP